MRLALAALLLPAALLAQFDQGQIAGLVRDSSEAVVSGASVTVQSLQNRAKQTITSSPEGSFVFASLPVGLYEVAVEAPGFKRYVETKIKVDAASRTSLNITLQVGALTETVSVTASTVQIQEETAQIGRVVEAKQITDLALNGRNPINLALMKAGVVGGNFNSFNPDDLGTGGFSVNGGRTTGNNITLDGVNAVRTRSGTAALGVFNVDTIQEVQILTATYPAEFGRVSDGQIRFVTKSGGSEFHGSLYHFLRNSALDANAWTRNQSPNPTENSRPAPFRFNQPGYTIGGPVFLPKKFNTDRSKLFFFVSQEWVRFRREQTSTGITPSLAMRRGDFSELLSATNPFFGRVRLINDPLSGLPFPGNIIPTNRTSPNGLALLRAFPEPTPGFQQGNINWITSLAAPRNSRKDLFRIDLNAGRNRITFSGQNYNYFVVSPFRGNFDRVGEVSDRPNQTGSLSVTTTVSPNKINEFTFSAANDKVNITLAGDRPSSRSNYGINYPYLFPGTKENDRIPTVSVNGFSVLDGGPYPAISSGPMYTLANNFTWISGRHTLKFGGNIEHAQQNNFDQIIIGNVPGGTNNQNGRFEFLDSGNPQSTGLAVANAALGVFNSYGEIGQRAYTLLRSHAFEGFFQDTWRVNQKLTLELGLRYSWYQPWFAVWNDIANFDAQAYDPARRTTVNPTTGAVTGGDPYNGIVLPGAGFPDSARGRIPAELVPNVNRLFSNQPRSLINDSQGAFAPRVGVAYRVAKGTVIRTGFGAFYHRTLFLSSSLFGNPPHQLTQGVTNGSVDAPGGATRREFPFQVRALDRVYAYPTAYTYSFSLQRQLPLSVLLDLAYVGKNSINLRRSRNLNQLPVGTVQRNPGVNPDALRPFHGLGLIDWAEHTGRANYHSFQLSADRRFSNGFGFGLSYTWSKNIDNTATPWDAYNMEITRGLSSLDRPHLLNLNFIYELPLFRSNRYLGGWQVSGVIFYRAGNPLSVLDATDTAGVGPGSGAQPWNVTGSTEVTGERGINLPWFNRDAFSRPAAGTFGNAGVSILRGPSFQNWDAALFKNFRLTERFNAQFRAEAFNFPNHPVLANPVVDPRNGAFGRIQSKSNERNLQLGLKLLF